MSAFAATASAQYHDPSPLLPSPRYVSASIVTFTTPFGPIVVSAVDLSVLNNRIAPPLVGSPATITFDASATMSANMFGFPVQLQSPGTGGALITPVSGTLFDMEVLQMDLSGGNLPTGSAIRESPTLSSVGQTSVTPSGGDYVIDSFFDVFAELTLDGGQTWIDGDQSFRFQGVPEPASIAILGLGLAGVAAKRRRK